VSHPILPCGPNPHALRARRPETGGFLRCIGTNGSFGWDRVGHSVERYLPVPEVCWALVRIQGLRAPASWRACGLRPLIGAAHLREHRAGRGRGGDGGYAAHRRARQAISAMKQRSRPLGLGPRGDSSYAFQSCDRIAWAAQSRVFARVPGSAPRCCRDVHDLGGYHAGYRAMITSSSTTAPRRSLRVTGDPAAVIRYPSLSRTLIARPGRTQIGRSAPLAVPTRASYRSRSSFWFASQQDQRNHHRARGMRCTRSAGRVDHALNKSALTSPVA
jgi:hypothetical protein